MLSRPCHAGRGERTSSMGPAQPLPALVCTLVGPLDVHTEVCGEGPAEASALRAGVVLPSHSWGDGLFVGLEPWF